MITRNFIAVLLLFVFLFTAGCQATPTPAVSAAPTPVPSPSATPAPTPTPDPMAEAMAAMTTEEKVGQLLTVGFYGTQAGEEARSYVQDYHVGGLILFGRNVESAQQLVDLTNGLKALAGDGIPLFLSIDQEGGTVERMPPEIRRLPNAYEVADPAALGATLGAECAAFGLNTDFAPSPQAFQDEAAKRIREIHMYDVLRADRCISVNSLEARVPFGDLDFVRYVMSIDPKLKRNVYGKGKYLLRRAFEGDYLPSNILYREKAAFSDAVGHSLVDDLKAYAETCYTDAEFEVRRQRFTHAQPFTKESLLYRELFEKYYPGQSQMVADFWMPNRDWQGCDVNDPSARVLSNYGLSGQ